MTKQELIDKYREINVDGDWWYESVYEWFVEECDKRGVRVYQRTSMNRHNKPVTSYDITWSGFWSQGDGAAFAGEVIDLDKVLGVLLDDYPILQKYVDELGGWWLYSWGLGRGNNIVTGPFEMEGIENYLDDDHPFTEIWQEQLNKEVDMVEALLSGVAHDLCGLLYKALEDEYEAMTTDEAVWETIVANDLDKELEEDDE